MKKEILTEKEIKAIRKYYESVDLFLPSRSNWRYFLFKLPSNTFKRFDSIQNIENLRKLLIKYTPIKVYFSASCWLNVENVRGRVKTKNFPIFIYSDVIFDIDSENLEEARLSTLEIIKRIRKKPDKIVQTVRGYHIWYLKQGKNRKKWLEKVKDVKNLDYKCTENIYNVFALPQTLKKGQICRIISLEALKKPSEAPESLIYTPLDTKDRVEKPLKRLMKNESLNFRESRGASLNMGGAGATQTVLSFSNRVKKKIFIPILIYNKDFIKPKQLKEELDILAKHFNLGSLYVFENENSVSVISLRCMQYRQLERLLNSSSSLNKEQFKKFKKTWFYFSEFKFVGKINYKVNKFFRVSKRHYKALKEFSEINVNKINEFIGGDNLRVCEVCKK